MSEQGRSARSRLGKPVVIPATDTVYGLATSPFRSEYVEQPTLPAQGPWRDKQPTALMATDVDMLLASSSPSCAAVQACSREALLPGPLTLVLPNPARRFSWLTGNGTTRSASACRS